MGLNVITDPWIPVIRTDGARVMIAPWQVADPSLAFPAWPRADLNIGCLELLIGLVSMADPPADAEEWQGRCLPDPSRLRQRLEPYAPVFELLGDGPRFMQDLEPFEAADDDPSSTDMLFIDSAGGQSARNNADLMVKRDRYAGLDPATAAIALYTLQAHAPAGGKGNRTSMRGGGPLVTLIDPNQGLWSLIWANVSYGQRSTVELLPWTRPTRTSEKEQVTFPHDVSAIEAFFGMPRRLRLVAEKDRVIGVAQKPYGTNYSGWEHPLTPHYRQKAGSELLPRHPRAGAFGYRNWLGYTARRNSKSDDTARRAKAVDTWSERASGRFAEVIVAGWSMENMKPRDFIYSRAPLLDLPDDVADRMDGMVKAADAFAFSLRSALGRLMVESKTSDKSARELAREEFFVRTQSAFEQRLGELSSAELANFEAILRRWLEDMRIVAMSIFDAAALPGLGERRIEEQQAIVEARRNLASAFLGFGSKGGEAFAALGLAPPEQNKRKARAP